MPDRDLIIGRGGLLGGSLAALQDVGGGRTGIHWGDLAAARVQLASLLDAALSRTDGHQLTVYWCAGAGFVGAGEHTLYRETELLEPLLAQLEPFSSRVTMFLASSAGAIHAGGPSPSTEQSVAAPLTAYGFEKLRQEQLLRAWCERSGGRAIIGRLSNLYGPGQDLSKPQGLISQLIRASLTGRPLTIFVPLETSRDYLFVHDAAKVITAATGRVDTIAPGEAVTKIIASGRLTTIGSVVAELGRLRKKRPPVVFGSTAARVLQPRALGFRSIVWRDLDAIARTTMAEGISAVLTDQLRSIASGGDR